MKTSKKNILLSIVAGKIKTGRNLIKLLSPPAFQEVTVCHRHKKLFDFETGQPLDYSEFEEDQRNGQVIDFSDNLETETCLCPIQSLPL